MDYSTFLLLLMKYVIRPTDNAQRAWPLGVQEAVTILLRVGLAAALSSHNSLSLRAHGGSNVLGHLGCPPGPHTPGPGQHSLQGPWLCSGSQQSSRNSLRGSNLNEVVQAQIQGPLTPSTWQTREPASLQCHRIWGWAFKEMIDLRAWRPVLKTGSTIDHVHHFRNSLSTSPSPAFLSQECCKTNVR